MCIAIVKPSGVKLPSKEILETCFNNNPDGCGFALNDGIKTYGFKGYMSFKKFYKALMKVDETVNLENRDLIIHFRIGTSGGNIPQNTHPFAISTDLKDLQKTTYVSKYSFAHNGIISGYGCKDYSDTMEYVTKIIANINDLKHSQKLIDNLAKENSSRFAILFDDGYMLGGDWIEKDGVYYSNTSYEKRTYYYSKYDWDDKWWEKYNKKYNTKDYLYDTYEDEKSVEESEVYDLETNGTCEACEKKDTHLYWSEYYCMDMCQDCIEDWLNVKIK